MKSNDADYVLNGIFGEQLDEVVEAAHLCMSAHAGQFRRNNEVLYAIHPIRMLILANSVCSCPEYVKAAILIHDVFEDTAVTPKDAIKCGVSEKAVEIAKELTRKPVDKANSEWRQMRLQQLLEKSQRMTNEARFIKALDRVDNLADGFKSFSSRKLSHYVRESIQLLEALSQKIPVDFFEKEVMLMCRILRRTINTIIEQKKAESDENFMSFPTI